MGGAINNIGSTVMRGVGDIVTLGGNEALGNPVGKGTSSLLGKVGFKDSGKNSGPATNAGEISPMMTLQQTGGAPLLAGIAMGADVNQSLMSFFGASGKFEDWMATLDPQSQDAVKGLSTQLTSISQNTQLKQQAVTSLINDFPNFMKSAVPQYADIADKYTMAAAQQALNQTAAKYAAGGALSSGAMDEAMARTGANNAYKNLSFGADLAGQDFSQQFSAVNALNEFQKKMLGQGVTDGFNAIQNMWSANSKQTLQNTQNQFTQNTNNQNANGALGGAFGKVAGGLLGGAFGGPGGAAAGSTLGGAAGTYLGSQQ